MVILLSITEKYTVLNDAIQTQKETVIMLDMDMALKHLFVSNVVKCLNKKDSTKFIAQDSVLEIHEDNICRYPIA